MGEAPEQAADTAATKSEPASPAGGLRAGVQRLRGSATTFNRILVLGFATLVASSMLHYALTLHVLQPLLAGRITLEPGLGSDLFLACYQQLSLLIVLPLLAWGAGWIFDGRALPLTLGAALFSEAWMAFVAYLGDGMGVFTTRPLLPIFKLLLAVGIAFLAAKAFRHAQGRLEAMSAANRRVAPAAAQGSAIPSLTPEQIAAAKAAAAEEAVLGDDEVEPVEPDET